MKIILMTVPEFLMTLMDCLFKEDLYPSSWKAEVILIPNATTGTSKDYRPVTLLPFFVKTLEKILIHRLAWWQMKEAKISNSQHGFTAGRSTISALKEVTQLIQRRRRQKQFVAAISFDISGAFDCVTIIWSAHVCS